LHERVKNQPSDEFDCYLLPPIFLDPTHSILIYFWMNQVWAHAVEIDILIYSYMISKNCMFCCVCEFIHEREKRLMHHTENLMEYVINIRMRRFSPKKQMLVQLTSCRYVIFLLTWNDIWFFWHFIYFSLDGKLSLVNLRR
jgi:hypothetical protein